ncbi:MAG: hypothetical protein ABI673_02635 [Novosphingobium sp.]
MTQAGANSAGNAGLERAVFIMQKPVCVIANGRERETCAVDMRALNVTDLPALDRLRGKPIALAQHLVSILCDIPEVHVPGMCLADFTMLACDALFDVERISLAMGLPGRFFLECSPPDDTPADELDRL